MSAPPAEPPAERAAEAVRRLVMGHFASQAVYVVAKLRIADLLAEQPRRADELAAATGSHEPSLARVLGLIVRLGLVTRSPDGRFELTTAGRCLTSDAPGSVRAAAELFCEEPYRAAADLLHTVRTGETAFDHVFGRTHFEHLESDAAAGRTFHEAMTQLTSLVAREVLASIELATGATVVDVGGGAGVLLGELLLARPDLTGVLFEAPGAADAARRALSGQAFGDRCRVVEGDLFDGPPAGGDLYVLKSVLHTFDDRDAERALRACAAAMGPDARLLVVERVIPDDDHEDGYMPALNDVVMLAVTGGRERTMADYRRGFAGAGLAVARVTAAGASGFTVIEARLDGQAAGAAPLD